MRHAPGSAFAPRITKRTYEVLYFHQPPLNRIQIENDETNPIPPRRRSRVIRRRPTAATHSNHTPYPLTQIPHNSRPHRHSIQATLALMKPLRRVAVLGAGTMGSRIAAHFANAGFPVDL